MEKLELDWLKKWNLYSPQAVAVVDGERGTEFTYADLYRQAQAMAAVLKDQYQVSPGDRLATLCLNEPEMITLLFAAQRLGATIVPINYRLTAREVEHIVEDSQVKYLFYQQAFKEVVNRLPEVCRKRAFVFNETAESLVARTQSSRQLFPEFLSKAEDAAMIIYTSGTTGAPKGAVISHRMLFWNSVNTSWRLNIVQSDSAVIFLPLFHTGGWNVLTTPFLHRGARIVLIRKFDAGLILQLSEKYAATLLFGVPTTMDMMARQPEFEQVQLSKVRYAIVGGEPMPLPLIEKWHQKGIKIRQGYGLTEFGPNVFSLNEEDAIRKIGSIGFPNFYIDVKVVDEQGDPVPANTVGELWLSGPACMTGYWGNEAATAATIQNGWLATGDLVRFDEEGYFYVVGRKKEMYKSGGENVYPAEVEKVIRTLPGIREAAVIGIQDEKWGEVGQAFVSLEKGFDLNEEIILQHCLKNLAKFKVPRRVQILAELPKGDSGKILKKNLREVASQQHQ